MDELQDGGEEDVDIFEPHKTVWNVVLEQCPRGELDEVKRLLGTSLVEQVIDLQEEVLTMLDIWRQMREVTMTTRIRPQLPEPPHVRERLVKEIKFFVDSLQKRSVILPPALGLGPPQVLDYVNLSSTGSSVDMLSRREGPVDKEAWPSSARGEGMGSRRSGRSSRSRLDSALSSLDGRESPLRSGPSSGRQSSSLGENLEGELSDQINSNSIDQIISKLREGLELDCEQCRQDLQFLHSCVDGEQDYSSSLKQQQEMPTLSELRELGSKLEKEFLSSSSRHALPGSLERRPNNVHLMPVPPAAPKPQGLMLNRASKVRREFDVFNGRSPLATSDLETSSSTQLV